MKKKKGFTLIELLVVISIIGILAAILFVAINPKEQSDKAKDVIIKASLSQIRTQATIDYLGRGYSGLCNDRRTNTWELIKKAHLNDYALGCHDSFHKYRILVRLNNNSTDKFAYCVDSSGYSGSVSLDRWIEIDLEEERIFFILCKNFTTITP